MALLGDVEPRQRVGAGLLFLIIAMGVLVVQPATPVLTATIASINLLFSALFLLTVGRDTTTATYDVGFWLLSIVVALAVYLSTTIVLTGTIDLFQVLVFTIVFGLVLGLLAELRANLTDRRDRR
ncbi:hypothetical protein [Natronomonas salsuginis]|jgi:hypothetical protein|uniref:Uncharacterized protein n=1 Tax=Natronomonas salsuginis TaxID=2217661 RepID=A0A4U5JFW2_9EURY|nr:hypothetical protein [Natronomonas salsuginis]TKR24939.1 hypothetical protein DM868_13525 [Natronomonas salsuginis]